MSESEDNPIEITPVKEMVFNISKLKESYYKSKKIIDDRDKYIHNRGSHIFHSENYIKELEEQNENMLKSFEHIYKLMNRKEYGWDKLPMIWAKQIIENIKGKPPDDK